MIGFAECKSEVLSALREVAELASQTGADSISQNLEEERIPSLEKERFHLVVLGEFNHGKTTFVNALLGKKFLPAGVTPTTAVIHHIEQGPESKIVAVAEDGTETPVPLEDLERYVVEGDAKKSDVQRLEVSYPATILRRGVVLVDTPGVNDLNLQRAEITYGYLPRADAVIFLLDAGQILKESERRFIENKLLAGSKDKLLFVINKMDLLSEEEREEALAYARKHLGELIDDPRVYPLSAEQALAGDHVDSGLEAFVADLEIYLEQDRGRILLDNALDEGLRTANVLRTSLEVRRRALGMEKDELSGRLQALEAELEGSGDRSAERLRTIRESVAVLKADVRRQIEEFGEGFAHALPQEIEGADPDDLKRFLPGFIQDRFREFVEQESDGVTRKLERLAEEAVAFLSEDARARSSRLKEALGPSAADLDLTINTFAFDVGVFALGAFGLTIMALSNILVGGALALAAPILAYVSRGRADRQLKERAMEEAPRAVREACQKLAEAFEQQIDLFGEKLEDFVSRATEEMTRSLAEVVRHARDAQQEGTDAVESLEGGTGPLVARLAAVDHRMTGLRAKLWGAVGTRL